MTAPDDTHGDLLRLHAEVDAETSRLHERHRERLQCRRGCSDCCVDDLTILDLEAERIRRKHAELLVDDEPHPRGACAFLDVNGACRIYEDRPYVCRTQGLPLRWYAEGPGGATVENRDICPLNEEGEPLLDLPPEDCFLLGPAESRLAALQDRTGGRGRVALRDLFAGTKRG